MNVWRMSLAAGLLILIVIVLRAFFFYRLPKTMFLALWGIALARLLIPFSVPAKFSVTNLFKYLGLDFVLHFTKMSGRKTGYIIHRGAEDVIRRVFQPLPLQPLFLLWITGMAVLTLFFLFSFVQSYRRIRTALPLEDTVLIQQGLRVDGLNCPFRVLVSDRITTPLAFGILEFENYSS